MCPRNTLRSSTPHVSRQHTVQQHTSGHSMTAWCRGCRSGEAPSARTPGSPLDLRMVRCCSPQRSWLWGERHSLWSRITGQALKRRIDGNLPDAWGGSRARTLNDARGIDPGWVDIMPRNLVTVHVRTWLLSAHTGRKQALAFDLLAITLWTTTASHWTAQREISRP